VEETEPVAYEGLLLGFQYVDFVPVTRAGKVVGGLTGLELLAALRMTKNSGFHYLLETKMADICRPVGLAELDASLESVLDTMHRTKNGNVCVIQDEKLIATISLRDIMRYATSLSNKTNVMVSELANSAVTLASHATMVETLDLMMSKEVRRILIQTSGSRKIADDRVVVEHAFNHDGIIILRDNPDKFWNFPMCTLPLRDPGSIGAEADVAEAWKAMYASPAQCLLVNEKKILTPWDVVIRLHDLHRFPVDTALETIIANAFEATLKGLLGETAAKTLLLKLETDFAITPHTIYHNPSEFSKMLGRILGRVNSVVERAFLRQLYARIGISPLPYSNLNDALSYIKERFGTASTEIADRGIVS